jgi:predicted chitinase
MRATEFISEDISRRGFLGGLLGAAALGAAGTKDAEAKTAPLKPKTKSPSDEVIKQANKQQTTKKASPTKNPQAEALLYRTAKASGMKGSELAQFLAQTKHESWDHSRLQEKPVGDPQKYFTKKYDPTHAPKTAKILGNKLKGDGAKYHGRGFIQLTGRDNYRMASEALGLDLINRPELAERPDVAAKIALWYWETRVKPKVKNFDDTVAVTKTINNAMFGLEDRLANFIDYKKRVA